MLRLLTLLIGAAHAQVATSHSYLIFSSQALCLQRSQQMCQAMGCDGVHTIFWWDCSTGPLNAGLVGPTAVTSGSYAMRIDIGTPFDVTASNKVSNGTQGLTTQEQASLASSTAMAAVIPSTTVQSTGVSTGSAQAIP